jgi:hypothetical protein
MVHLKVLNLGECNDVTALQARVGFDTTTAAAAAAAAAVGSAAA